MSTTGYSNTGYAEAASPGERIPGPPSAGLIAIWIMWLLAAAVLFGEGAIIGLGILQQIA